MLSARYSALAIGVMLIALASNASAQWSPGGAMVYMGDLNLEASFAMSGKNVHPLGGSPEIQAPTNNSSTNNSSLNSSMINGTSIDKSTTQSSNDLAVNLNAVPSSADDAEPTGKEILDLSGYSRDRTNRNLAGYTNIMYPITGSRGTTTSTAGGAGCGGGCGA